MKTVFTGYYGKQNTGDDAFCIVSDWGARKYWHHKDVSFLGRDLPLRTDGIQLKSEVPKKDYFRYQHFLEYFSQGFQKSRLVYAGGSVFHTAVKGITKDSIFNSFNRLSGKKLGAIGVSIGPYKDGSAYSTIKDYLSKFSFLAVRDHRSYLEVMDMQLNIPIIEAFDLAAILPLIYKTEPKQKNNNTIAVSVCNYERYKNEDLKVEEARFKKIVNTLNIFKAQNPDSLIKILIFNGNKTYGDVEISNKLYSEIKNKRGVEIIPYNPNPEFMWQIINDCSAVLSTRLHAGIFSCFTKTPFIQIEYHKKCGDFLNDINYNEAFKIGDFEISEKEVAMNLLKLTKDNHDLVRQESIDKCIEMAKLNFTSVIEYL